MVSSYSVYWTPEAKNDLRSILDYITQVESRARALYVITGIREKANEAVNFPTKHAIEPIMNHKNIRFIIKWSYKIIFEIKDNTIRILSIFHTAQNPDKITLLI
jgi:plasmid stabilization system protein ParE